MRGIAARQLTGVPVTQWQAPPRQAQWSYQHTLTTTTGLTTGTGSWSATAAGLTVAGAQTSTNRALADQSLNLSKALHVLEVEVKTPATWTAESHIDIGFTTSTSATGHVFAALRHSDLFHFVRDGVQWETYAPYPSDASSWWL